MKQKPTLARIATVISSLVLVGGYVAYRAIWAGKPVSNASEPQAEAEPEKVFMSGSKREEIFTPPKDPPKKFMGGSKSMMILDPEEDKKPLIPSDVKPDAEKPPSEKKPH